MKTPIVSVVMSVYKEPFEWLRQSIDSILNQTFGSFEFIIVNDNPESEVLDSFLRGYEEKDHRIIVIKNKENIGLTRSLNIGIEYSKGEYIARMDADDISYPDRFFKQVRFMAKNPEVIVCGTRIKLFGKKLPFYCHTVFERDLDIRGQMLLNSGFAHPSVMIRKQILIQKSVRYDEKFRTGQDYKLWWDLNEYGKFANLPENLLKYRISDQHVSNKLSGLQKNGKSIIQGYFRKKWLSDLAYRSKKIIESDIEEVDVNKDLTHDEDRTMYEYFLRALQYESISFKNLFTIFFSPRIKISIKERLILGLLSIKRAIGL